MTAFFLSLSNGKDTHSLPSPEAALAPVRHVVGTRVTALTTTVGDGTLHYYGTPESIFLPDDQAPGPGFLVAGRINPTYAQRLIPDLQRTGNRDLSTATPLAWIAEAWALWGERTLERLDGDFGLVVVDLAQGDAWIATDHFAVVPMHFASTPDALLVSNLLHSVVGATGAGEQLNDQTLADFLLFGHSRSATATIYEGIERLPPASCVRWRGSAINRGSWWSLPESFAERVGSDEDLAMEFRGRLEQAVEAARDGRATGVLTSSGMDSTSLAALSAGLSKRDANCGPTLLATLDTPESPELSELALSARLAQELGVEHLALPSPAGALFDPSGTGAWPAPEPCWHQWNRFMQPGLGVLAGKISLGMTGQGGDMVLYPNPHFFVTQLKRGRWIKTAQEWAKFRKTQPRRPALGIKSSIWGTQRYDEVPALPRWFRAGFASETGLQQRLDLFVQRQLALPQNPQSERPQAMRQLSDPYLGFVLGGHAPSTTGVALEFTHPFLATEVLEFALGIRSPSLLYGKRVLRLAMQSLLPDFILSQRKRLIAPSVRRDMILATDDRVWRQAAEDLERFDSVVDPGQFLSVALKRNQLNSTEAELLKLPLVLRNWHATCRSNRPGIQ